MITLCVSTSDLEPINGRTKWNHPTLLYQVFRVGRWRLSLTQIGLLNDHPFLPMSSFFSLEVKYQSDPESLGFRRVLLGPLGPQENPYLPNFEFLGPSLGHGAKSGLHFPVMKVKKLTFDLSKFDFIEKINTNLLFFSQLYSKN